MQACARIKFLFILIFCCCCRFGEHEGSYCTVASFETDGSAITNTINTTTKADTMTPLRVTVSPDQMLQQENVANQMQQRSPSRSVSSHRSKLSPASSTSSLSSLSPPIRSVHPSQQFRVGCFYPNYEPQVIIHFFSISLIIFLLTINIVEELVHLRITFTTTRLDGCP